MLVKNTINTLKIAEKFIALNGTIVKTIDNSINISQDLFSPEEAA